MAYRSKWTSATAGCSIRTYGAIAQAGRSASTLAERLREFEDGPARRALSDGTLAVALAFVDAILPFWHCKVLAENAAVVGSALSIPVVVQELPAPASCFSKSERYVCSGTQAR